MIMFSGNLLHPKNFLLHRRGAGSRRKSVLEILLQMIFRPMNLCFNQTCFSSIVASLALLTLGILNASTVHAQATLTANNLDQLRTYAAMDNVDVTLVAGEYWLEGDGTNPNFLDFSGSNSTFDLAGAQIKMDTRELAGYGNGQGVRPITMTGSNNHIQGLDFAGYDIDLATDPNARRYADRSAVYLEVTGSDNHFQDTRLLVRGSNPYGYGDVFGKGARFPESGLPVEDGGFAFLSHDKTSSFLVTGGAENTVVDNLDLTSRAYGHGFFVQGGASNTTIRNSTITGELVSSNDAIAHPEYQEYAAGADGILGTPDDGGTRSGTPLPENIYLSAQEDGIRAYSGTSGLHVENTVVTNFRSGVHSTFSGGTNTADGVQAYGTENAFIVGSNTTITNSQADIVNGPAIYVQYNNDSNSSIDLEIVGAVPEGVDWAVAYVNGDNFDLTLRSDLPAGFLPENSIVRLGQTWFHNWRDQLKPTGPETASPGPLTNSTFNNLTNELTVLGESAVGNTGYSKAGVVTNGKENYYDGLSFVLSGTRVVLTSSAGLGNNGNDENGDFDEDVFETNASVVFDGATLELQSGLRISNEKLTITGDGIDGKGALYSSGTVDSDTRFGSANSGEQSAIFLDGNASIGVGVAGQQLNIGGLYGQGDFTKRGAGLLTVGKAGDLDGDLIVAEGHVAARTGVVNSSLTVAANASISGVGNFSFNSPDGIVFLDGTLDLNARTDSSTLTGTIGALDGNGVLLSSNPTAGSGGILILDGNIGEAEFSGTISTNISLGKSGGNDQWLSGSLTHSGTTTVYGGGLYIDGSHTNGGDYFVDNNGGLGGEGTIDAEVEILSGGVLSPGSPGSSTGTLWVSDVEFKDQSELKIEIGSATDFDQLLISDTMTVDSGAVLELVLVDGFVPSPGDEFLIIVADSFVGDFDSFNASVLAQGNWDFSRLSSAGIVEFVGGDVLLGDCNLDGFVTFLDIAPMITFLTSGNYFVEADCNLDGYVNFLDIAPFIAILTDS